METEIYVNCCSCGSLHRVNDAGDLELVEDNLPGRKGINGIRTHNVSGDDWQQRQYIETEPKKYQPPIERMMGMAGKSEPISASELLEANLADLKKRNLNTEN